MTQRSATPSKTTICPEGRYSLSEHDMRRLQRGKLSKKSHICKSEVPSLALLSFIAVQTHPELVHQAVNAVNPLIKLSYSYFEKPHVKKQLVKSSNDDDGCSLIKHTKVFDIPRNYSEGDLCTSSHRDFQSISSQVRREE